MVVVAARELVAGRAYVQGRARSITFSLAFLRSSGGGANGDLDMLELIDGRSYKLQCR